MSDRKRLLVYPFDLQFCPILRHQNLLKDYEITALVSPNGWGLTGKDACEADGGETTGIIVGNDFSKGLEMCDTVWFTDFDNEVNVDKLLYPKMIMSARLGKNIILTRSMSESAISEIRDICSQAGADFIYCNEHVNMPAYEDIVVDFEHVVKFQVPIVFVVGLAERTGKFHVQLGLREYFSNSGYKVSQIGSRQYCELLGFHSFPSFMFNDRMGESKKILLFNQFVKGIEENEDPDLIIIGVPGGTIPLNEMFTNNFGMLCYESCQAVIPDAAVYCSLYGDFKPEYFEKLFTSTFYKFGFETSCFGMSNQEFDWHNSKLEYTKVFTTVDYKLIEKKKRNFAGSKVSVYNILVKDDMTRMAELITNQLAGYAEVETL